MAHFFRTVCKSDGQERFYVSGCRVTKGTFYALHNGKRADFRQTQDKGEIWHHSHESPL